MFKHVASNHSELIFFFVWKGRKSRVSEGTLNNSQPKGYHLRVKGKPYCVSKSQTISFAGIICFHKVLNKTINYRLLLKFDYSVSVTSPFQELNYLFWLGNPRQILHISFSRQQLSSLSEYEKVCKKFGIRGFMFRSAKSIKESTFRCIWTASIEKGVHYAKAIQSNIAACFQFIYLNVKVIYI